MYLLVELRQFVHEPDPLVRRHQLRIILEIEFVEVARALAGVRAFQAVFALAGQDVLLVLHLRKQLRCHDRRLIERGPSGGAFDDRSRPEELPSHDGAVASADVGQGPSRRQPDLQVLGKLRGRFYHRIREASGDDCGGPAPAELVHGDEDLPPVAEVGDLAGSGGHDGIPVAFRYADVVPDALLPVLDELQVVLLRAGHIVEVPVPGLPVHGQGGVRIRGQAHRSASGCVEHGIADGEVHAFGRGDGPSAREGVPAVGVRAAPERVDVVERECHDRYGALPRYTSFTASDRRARFSSEFAARTGLGPSKRTPPPIPV